MKKTLKRNRKELKKDIVSHMNEKYNYDRFGLIDNHYLRSTVSFNPSNLDLKELTLREINECFQSCS